MLLMRLKRACVHVWLLTRPGGACRRFSPLWRLLCGLSLTPLRELEQAKPKDFQKLLPPPRPSPRYGGYKWMQFSYTVTAVADPPAAGSPSIGLFGQA